MERSGEVVVVVEAVSVEFIACLRLRLFLRSNFILRAQHKRLSSSSSSLLLLTKNREHFIVFLRGILAGVTLKNVFDMFFCGLFLWLCTATRRFYGEKFWAISFLFVDWLWLGEVVRWMASDEWWLDRFIELSYIRSLARLFNKMILNIASKGASESHK